MKSLFLEPIAKLLTLVKSRFWWQFSLRLLACPSGYVLVGATRAAKLVLKIVTKILDFTRIRSFAIGSLIFLLLFPFRIFAYETVVESDEVRYNGELITLTGNVTVENALGRVTAKTAILKKDFQKKTSIDFPWIELKQDVTFAFSEEGILQCESLFFDYTQMTSFFYGNPQVVYRGTFGEIHADRAQVDYKETEGSLEATKITLFENVRLTNKGTEEKPASQYALADVVYYFPAERLTILEGVNNQVIFYDQLRDMQLSARTVRAQKDPVTKNETVHGIGDVRFIFGPDELEKIKQRFSLK